MHRRKARNPSATSRLMRAVRRKNTGAEIALRAALRKANIFCSTHDCTLPGTPDLLVRDKRTAIFVDGDYWHGRIYLEKGLGALQRSFRSASRRFWVAKILRNAKRDRRQERELRTLGWQVVRIWESDILGSPAKVVARIRRSIRMERTLIEATKSVRR